MRPSNSTEQQRGREDARQEVLSVTNVVLLVISWALYSNQLSIESILLLDWTFSNIVL